MRARERRVRGRVPVLGVHDAIAFKRAYQRVAQGHDVVAARDLERAAGAEVALDVDHEERVGGAGGESVRNEGAMVRRVRGVVRRARDARVAKRAQRRVVGVDFLGRRHFATRARARRGEARAARRDECKIAPPGNNKVGQGDVATRHAPRPLSRASVSISFLSRPRLARVQILGRRDGRCRTTREGSSGGGGARPRRDDARGARSSPLPPRA